MQIMICFLEKIGRKSNIEKNKPAIKSNYRKSNKWNWQTRTTKT